MYYKNITIFELIKRTEFLIQAKKDIVDYFINLNSEYPSEESANVAQLKRQKINLYLIKLITYVKSAGIETSVYYSPPPVIGGLAGDIDIVANIFNLHGFDISPQMIIDKLDQSIGVYDDERTRALIRTFNPFWWLWKVFKWIANIPFWVLKEIGFNTSKIESSFLGKILKFIFEVVTFLAALFAVLNALGYNNVFIHFFKKVLRLP